MTSQQAQSKTSDALQNYCLYSLLHLYLGGSDIPIRTMVTLSCDGMATTCARTGKQELTPRGRTFVTKWLSSGKGLLSRWRHAELPVVEHPVAALARFTRAEGRVLPLLASSLSYREAAIELGLSERTVQFHATNIYSKLGVDGRRGFSHLVAQYETTSNQEVI